MSHMSNSGHLVVDALNFLNFFTPILEPGYSVYNRRGGGLERYRATPWQLYNETEHRVDCFLNGCKLAQLQPHFVFDAGIESEEANAKWRQRREREVISEKRSVPCDSDFILAELLRKRGADVLQAPFLDADDVVARVAIELSAVILSEDVDMLRYTDLADKRDRIKESFAFHSDGRIVLIPRVNFEPKVAPTQRTVGGMKLDLASWRQPFFKFDPRHAKGYVRGNADAFTKQMGNAFQTVRPLRQALYARLGLDKVFESFPVWGSVSENVTWEETNVTADAGLDHLLNDEKAAMMWMISQEGAGLYFPTPWHGGETVQRGRLHTKAMVVAELIFLAQLAAHSTDNVPLDSFEVIEIAKRLDRCGWRNDHLRLQSGPSFQPDPRGGQVYSIPEHMLYRVCSSVGCERPSNCPVSEMVNCWEKGWQLPKKCRLCRLNRKQQMHAAFRLEGAG